MKTCSQCIGKALQSVKNWDRILEYILKKWGNVEDKFGYMMVFPKLIHIVGQDMIIWPLGKKLKMSNKQIVLDKIVDDFVDNIVEYFTRRKFYVSISESKLKNTQFTIKKKKSPSLALVSTNNYLRLWTKMFKWFINFTVEKRDIFVETVTCILKLFPVILLDITTFLIFRFDIF